MLFLCCAYVASSVARVYFDVYVYINGLEKTNSEAHLPEMLYSRYRSGGGGGGFSNNNE